jgi:hypothetical protein
MSAAPPSRRRLRLVSFKELRKGGLIGFCTIEMAPGLSIVDCPIQASHGKVWCGLPAKPVLDQNGRQVVVGGKKQFSLVLKWRNRDLSDRFSERVVELVRQQYPGMLP